MRGGHDSKICFDHAVKQAEIFLAALRVLCMAQLPLDFRMVISQAKATFFYPFYCILVQYWKCKEMRTRWLQSQKSWFFADVQPSLVIMILLG